MKKLLPFLVLLFINSCTDNGSDPYTLYRNSVLDKSSRIHIATFDSKEGNGYNMANCNIAQDLFQNQPFVETRFWCEKGFYKN